MFAKGTTSMVMIGVSFIMTGTLIGMAIQPVGGGLRTVLILFGLIMGTTAVLALMRHSQDEYNRGTDNMNPQTAHNVTGGTVFAPYQPSV